MYKKIISAILVLCMACSPLLIPVISADTKTDSYNKKISDLQSKEKEYQEKLNKTKSDIKDKEEYSSTLVSQIDVLSTEISESHREINKLNKSIAKKHKAINSAKKDIETQMDTLKKRIRTIYMAGNTSDLEIILGARDFGDFIDKCELIKTLSAYDKQLIDKIQVQLDKITEEKKDLVSEKSQAEESEKILQNKQDKLSTLLDENEEILSKLYDDQNDAKKLLNNANSQEAEIQNQLSAYYRKLDDDKNADKASNRADEKASQREVTFTPGGTGSGSGSASSVHIKKSGFAWPVPGYYYIISPFNENRGYSHKGIDITGGGIMGANVVAAYGGTVVASNNSCSHNWGKSGSCGCGGGYGNYVLIDHGNGKQTLYGHLSSTTVSTYKKVKKGQTIGYVGSTGWSTGAHLHFECRYGGSVYNPMNEY